ncbi:GNAT family N-acetyltransferase [Cellvibrio japonicus]|uniref:Putative acetyltransferase, GNAT family n=1 Tax=Cellvibrio japonicus (strain Ueda107) TaxID=498211 RepID=B3PKP1_CELJU|nr:GNAT family N-acetyltransferase [Cellvibrio japonicus]ACE85628.1 putative acetyltransferase, GNAT family [Cellvibrio japonicus Ueda107]QEI11451.1 GNAT family N-acetyltransferase [Cellvibrio japonicus]QEI15025.1 GNAT family N-acetyltransferase [Cellvibrio japonicus]QEI18605.1 GNAT family N-acetyltransferase [Cellvibrio japonicus]
MITTARCQSPAFAVIPLQDAPQHFSQVASWHHQECERQGLKSTLVLRQQRLMLHMQTASIPTTLVALVNQQLVGCVSLVDYTYRTSQRMPKVNSPSPLWLSNLYVDEVHRRCGIGNQLIDAAKQYARLLNADELWLSASDFTDYYQKRGWSIERRTRLAGRPVNVMRVLL